MVTKSSPFNLVHILIRRSSLLSRSQAEAWHTTSRSRGRVTCERVQKLSGKGAKPSEEKKPSPAFTIFNGRSEEHTSELQSLMRISYAVFCLKKKKKTPQTLQKHHS